MKDETLIEWWDGDKKRQKKEHDQSGFFRSPCDISIHPLINKISEEIYSLKEEVRKLKEKK